MKSAMIIGATALSLFLLEAHAATLAISAEEQRMLGIETAPVERIDDAAVGVIDLRVTFSPDAHWVIRAPLSGVLGTVSVREGDHVREGEPLALMHSAAFVALQQDYLEARARYEAAEAARARDAKLREAGSISERRWQETRYAHAAARAQRAGLEAQLRVAGLDGAGLETLVRDAAVSPELTLRAPATALVLERDADPGARLDGSETLLRLGDPGKLVLEGVLARAAAASLHQGMRLRSREGVGATLSFVATVVDPRSQTVAVRAIPDDPGALFPGELSAWSVVAGREVLTVPAGAVVRLGGRDLVYVAAAQGFEEREIEARATGDGAWVVNAGLAEGERIAVRGTAALKGLSLGMGGAD